MFEHFDTSTVRSEISRLQQVAVYWESLDRGRLWWNVCTPSWKSCTLRRGRCRLCCIFWRLMRLFEVGRYLADSWRFTGRSKFFIRRIATMAWIFGDHSSNEVWSNRAGWLQWFGWTFGFYKRPVLEFGLNIPGQRQEIASALALLSDLGYRAPIASRSLCRVWLLVWFHVVFVNLLSDHAPGDDYLSDCFAEALRARLPLREARGFRFWIVLGEKVHQELLLLPTLCQLRGFEHGKSASSAFCM